MVENFLCVTPDELFADISGLCRNGHKIRFTPKGMCMYPFIVGNRDSVVLHRADIIRRGDIVAARIQGKGCVLHRVYTISEDMVTLMGDSTLYAAENCTTKDVLATVIFIVRKGHPVNCHSARERLAVNLWMSLLPIRRYLLWVLRKLRYRL